MHHDDSGHLKYNKHQYYCRSWTTEYNISCKKNDSWKQYKVLCLISNRYKDGDNVLLTFCFIGVHVCGKGWECDSSGNSTGQKTAVGLLMGTRIIKVNGTFHAWKIFQVTPNRVTMNENVRVTGV